MLLLSPVAFALVLLLGGVQAEDSSYGVLTGPLREALLGQLSLDDATVMTWVPHDPQTRTLLKEELLRFTQEEMGGCESGSDASLGMCRRISAWLKALDTFHEEHEDRYTSVEDIRREERDALMELFDTCNGVHWKHHTHWGEGRGPCDTRNWWLGVACDQGRVVQLSLSDNNLTCPFPTSLFRLRRLEVLTLSFNCITGSIPDAIGTLKHLVALWLYKTALEGPLPVSLGLLPKLQVLFLDGNDFEGPIPSTFQSLVSIERIGLRNIPRLSGRLPSFLFHLPLKTLALSGTNVTGLLPTPDEFVGIQEVAIFENRRMDEVLKTREGEGDYTSTYIRPGYPVVGELHGGDMQIFHLDARDFSNNGTATIRVQSQEPSVVRARSFEPPTSTVFHTQKNVGRGPDGEIRLVLPFVKGPSWYLGVHGVEKTTHALFVLDVQGEKVFDPDLDVEEPLALEFDLVDMKENWESAERDAIDEPIHSKPRPAKDEL